MQPNIYEIIGIPAVCYIVIMFAVYPVKSYLKYTKPLKPLDCTLCLSWWVSLGYFSNLYGLKAILYAAICALIGALLERRL